MRRWPKERPLLPSLVQSRLVLVVASAGWQWEYASVVAYMRHAGIYPQSVHAGIAMLLMPGLLSRNMSIKLAPIYAAVCRRKHARSNLSRLSGTIPQEYLESS